MDNKRKASGVNGLENGADTPDRTAKRRKLQEEFGDLAKGESPESTTAYGLNILESIRATTDKNGRAVAPLFENLPTRSQDPEYYQKIKLPLSLQIIERKLNHNEYETLSILEGDFKRLVANAKEINHRNSEVFSDAERIRKAVSNLMVKFNPAYKSGNYQAVATPLPPSPGPEDGAEDDEDEDEENGNGDDGEDGEDDDEEDDDEELDDEDDDDDDIDASPMRRRRGPGRPPKTPVAQAQKMSRRSSSFQGKVDSQYEGVEYKGLSFQQAQEKIIEDLIREKDDEGYAYFLNFLNLPSRQIKDYYEVITEPMCLKLLQKQVIGKHGRHEATYVSDFKNWSTFEDQISLIWKNAYHYNEDGSDIFLQAQELEEEARKLLGEAKRHAPEPPQAKIKLKVPQSSEAIPQPKKITIHVGGKASATGSPAPPTARSGEGDITRNGTPVGRGADGLGNLAQLDKARSMSASVASPSLSAVGVAKVEDATRQGSAVGGTPVGTTFHQFAPPMGPHGGPMNGMVVAPPPPPKLTTAEILDAQKYRPHPIKEFEALLTNVVVASHPSLPLDKQLSINVAASTTEYQQELVLNAPQTHFRLQLKPKVAPFLEEQQREWRLNVMHDAIKLYPSAPPEKRNEPVFDVTLRFGTNRLEISLVAALPKGEKGPTGLGMEMEKVIVLFNLLRHS